MRIIDGAFGRVYVSPTDIFATLKVQDDFPLQRKYL